MSLLNEIKRNVSGAASVASKKTSELTGIAKLNVNIKLEETKLSECYEEIGRLFYTAERSGEDNTSDIATYIMQADKIKATIAGYKAELAHLKKVVVCEGCGAEISETAAYCSVCGTKQVKKVADDSAEEPEEGCSCEKDSAEETCNCGCETECAEDCSCEETCDCCCTETDDEVSEEETEDETAE